MQDAMVLPLIKYWMVTSQYCLASIQESLIAAKDPCLVKCQSNMPNGQRFTTHYGPMHQNSYSSHDQIKSYENGFVLVVDLSLIFLGISSKDMRTEITQGYVPLSAVGFLQPLLARL